MQREKIAKGRMPWRYIVLVLVFLVLLTIGIFVFWIFVFIERPPSSDQEETEVVALQKSIDSSDQEETAVDTLRESVYGRESFILCTEFADGPVGYGKGSYTVMGQQMAQGAVVVVAAEEGLTIQGAKFPYRQVVLIDERASKPAPRVATPEDHVMLAEAVEIFGKPYPEGRLIIPEDGLLPELAASDKKSKQRTTQSHTTSRIIEIEAPQAAVDLWRSWNNKYLLFAHQEAGIKSFEELAGKTISCAYINTDEEPWVCDHIMGDLWSLQTAGQIPKAAGIQNNPEYYDKQLLEDTAAIGFMSAGIARLYKFTEEKALVQLVLVKYKDEFLKQEGQPNSRNEESIQAENAVLLEIKLQELLTQNQGGQILLLPRSGGSEYMGALPCTFQYEGFLLPKSGKIKIQLYGVSTNARISVLMVADGAEKYIWEGNYTGRNIESPVIYLTDEKQISSSVTLKFSFSGNPMGGLEIAQGESRDTTPMITIYEVNNP